MKNLLLIIILVFNLSFSTKGDERNFEFAPNQPTYIQFVVKNLNEPQAYSILINETLPLRQRTLSVEFIQNGSFTKTIEINHPVYVPMYSGKEIINLFAIPNDTLTLTLDYSLGDKLNDVVSFSGSTGDISYYLTHIRQYFWGAPSKTQGVDEYNAIMDKRCNAELAKLDSMIQMNHLPQWYYPIESLNIKLDVERNKTDQFSQRGWMHKQYFDREVKFDRRFSDVGKNHCWIENNIYYLSKIRPCKFDSLLQMETATDEIILEYIQTNIDVLSNEITGYELSYYVASRISVLFFGNSLLKLTPPEFKRKTKEIDDLIARNRHLIGDSLIYKELTVEKEKKYSEYKNQNLLSKGNKAPNFYLQNKAGETRNLKDYKGKVVLLNFWATYCVPCIQSISEKNELAEELKESDFVLINICMDTNYKSWHHIIDSKQFKGEHLICKGNWKDNLSGSYNIYSVPHYTIVGRDGLVIHNGRIEDLKEILKQTL
ncbi:MAG: TlpA family protein disulfide reductase [Bacteroidales bacterium]|nr:TlpA family protein disulfide reductase [Bacteroidales bacterium]